MINVIVGRKWQYQEVISLLSLLGHKFFTFGTAYKCNLTFRTWLFLSKDGHEDNRLADDVCEPVIRVFRMFPIQLSNLSSILKFMATFTEY